MDFIGQCKSNVKAFAIWKEPFWFIKRCGSQALIMVNMPTFLSTVQKRSVHRHSSWSCLTCHVSPGLHLQILLVDLLWENTNSKNSRLANTFQWMQFSAMLFFKLRITLLFLQESQLRVIWGNTRRNARWAIGTPRYRDVNLYDALLLLCDDRDGSLETLALMYKTCPPTPLAPASLLAARYQRDQPLLAARYT